MSTEQFSKYEFEAAISAIATTEQLEWQCMGIVGSEYRYYLRVTADVFVYVNSSIGHLGHADGTGENSIRVWIADGEGKPLAKKDQEYVTRVKGWMIRMGNTIHKAVDTAKQLAANPVCPKCGSQMVRRTRRSDGNPFWGCKKFPTCMGSRNIENDKVAVQSRVDAMNGKPVENKIVEPEQPVAPKVFTPSVYQQAVFDWVKNPNKTSKSLFVEAVAGSGKTTTGVEMLKMLPADEETLFVAFNKHIAMELQKRAPAYVKVSTYHSLGYTAVRAAYGNVKVDEDKVDDLLNMMLDKNMWKSIFPAVKQLVSLVKANLTGTTPAELDDLATHYGIEMNGDTEIVFETVATLIEKCQVMTQVIDYDDMCWLPVVNHLKVKKYDNMFIDEAQDTNKNQIALAMMSIKETGLIIAVGDRHQSLYGFRGADVNAIPNLIENLNADTLPLSITYRCPNSVVKFVNDMFPEIKFEASEWAKNGKIMSITKEKALAEYIPGDMVLCRTNAPLVEPAFALIRRGVKAIIRGRDIGKGLIALIRKMKCYTLNDMLQKLTEYKSKEVAKLMFADKASMAQALTDKVETIFALSDGVYSLEEVESRIETIFSDEAEGVVFSSVHKAKGLEAERVYILRNDLMPHPMAKKDWEKQQERNIQYVAYTRTLNELIFVEGK